MSFYENVIGRVMLIDEVPTFTDFMLEELRGLLRDISIRKIAEVVSKRILDNLSGVFPTKASI
jgi:hypothetical protein